MFDEKEIQLIEKLAEAVGKSSEFILGAYAQHAMWGAAGSIVLGVFVCIFAMKVPLDKIDGADKICVMALRSIILFFGMLIIVGNIPDLIAPEAAAIHKVITDLKK